MSLKTKLIFAALGLAAVVACMKAGDGVGLDSRGQICTDNSTDSVCLPYIDQCKLHPTLPACQIDPCVANATSKACSTSICEKDPTKAWCQSVDCATTPTAKICADSCTAHPALAWCSPKVDCPTTPTTQVCVDSCKTNPALSWCGPAKTKFSEVYPLIQASICLAACHIPGGAGAVTGKLNMATLDSAYANLVGPLAADQTLAPGWARVKPGYPDSSIFYLKLAQAAASLNMKLPNGTTYGQTMPIGGQPFVKAKLDIIKKWITDGAVK